MTPSSENDPLRIPNSEIVAIGLAAALAVVAAVLMILGLNTLSVIGSATAVAVMVAALGNQQLRYRRHRRRR